MAQLDVQQKLAILADAAKYDASCASSGTRKRDSSGGKGIGSTEGMGICHAYAPDGRCISLLKILLTNSCIFDCHYCINRKSSNVRRARFTAQEVVRLTLAFRAGDKDHGDPNASIIVQFAIEPVSMGVLDHPIGDCRRFELQQKPPSVSQTSNGVWR